MNRHNKAKILIYIILIAGSLMWCLLIAMSLQGMFDGITDTITAQRYS